MAEFRSHYEAVVIGGGPVGAALALALGRAGMRLALVEAGDPPHWNDAAPPECRVSALNKTSERFLDTLSAWDRIRACRAHPFRSIRAWDAAGAGEIGFDSAELGLSCLGHIVEHSVLRVALWAGLATCPTVEIYHRRRVACLRADAGDTSTSVTLDDGNTLSANWVAGADGVESPVRRLAGIDAAESDYGQHAVVATVTTEHPHRDRALQRFLSTGPVALLPLGGNTASIVWSTTPHQARYLIDVPPEVFCTELGAAYAHALGAVTQVGARAAFPLRRSHARSYVRGRVALLGDAAHTLHPLAGLGMNLGLKDAAELAMRVLSACARGRDPGRAATLAGYQRARRGENLLMQAAMEGFHSLFAANMPLLVRLRNGGLDGVDRSGGVKRALMRYMVGV